MMITVGVTGLPGSGKSEVMRFWSARQVRVLSADRLAHQAMEPGQPAYDAVRERFGDAVLGPDGRIDRQCLAARVFKSEALLKSLNDCVHPVVIEAMRQAVEQARQNGLDMVACEVPLLFEAGLQDDWNVIVCVTAPEKQLLQRLARRGLDEEQCRLRLAAQWPQQKKAAKADLIIENIGTLNELEQKAVTVLEQIRNKENDRNG